MQHNEVANIHARMAKNGYTDIQPENNGGSRMKINVPGRIRHGFPFRMSGYSRAREQGWRGPLETPDPCTNLWFGIKDENLQVITTLELPNRNDTALNFALAEHALKVTAPCWLVGEKYGNNYGEPGPVFGYALLVPGMLSIRTQCGQNGQGKYLPIPIDQYQKPDLS